MLAKLSDEAFDDKDWVFEIKWDGYRAIADLSRDTPLFTPGTAFHSYRNLTK